ncbi:MAG: alpha/beta fold hydrolase [Actinomycetota bacterium]
MSPGPSAVPLSFEWEGLRLVGTLHPPADGSAGTGRDETRSVDRRWPAVVMAQGSGPADRDCGGYFPPIRDAFLRAGIATFAFDKPGCGESEGDWYHYGLLGRGDQLIAALDLLRHQPTVDADRVGLWGQSQGGWLVQLLAGGRTPLAFAIANSAPTLTVAQQIHHDIEQTLRAAGHGDADVEQALALADALHTAATDGTTHEAATAELLAPAEQYDWYRHFPGIDGPDDWRHLGLLVGEPFDPCAALARVECPILAVYGALDALLPPWRGAEETGVALASAPTTDAAVVVFPTGDHRIRHGDGTFAPGYLDLLGDWARRVIG